MSVLSEAEIEKLKQTHPQKRILRFLFLIIGSVIIVIGIMLFFIGIDFGIRIDDVNMSFIVDVLIVILGMILASKYFIAPYYLRENSLTIKKLSELREPVERFVKFHSFAITRLLAAILLIIAGIISLIVFSAGVGHHNTQFGNAISLGGPSFFYVTGLPPLIVGLLLVLYFCLSPFRGTFSQSENFYFFYEVRPGFPWLTEIPKKDIEAIRYQNNHLGPKLAWIMFFLPFIVLQLMTAIPLFSAERAAPENVLSWAFLMISFLEIIALVFLVIFPQNYYEIATKDMLYEMWFAPFRNRLELKKKLSNFFGCRLGTEAQNKMLETNDPLFSSVSKTHFHLFDTIFGLFLIISAIVALSNMILFGPFYWWIALMYGIMLVVKAICYDFSNKGEDNFYYDDQAKKFNFKRNSWFKFHYISAYNVESVRATKWFRKLDSFDVFGLSWLLIYLILQQMEGWSIAHTSRLILDNTISTLFMIVVLIFIILYLCLPIDVIEFKTPTITYRIRVTTKLKETRLKFLLKKYFTNLVNFPREALNEELRKTFLIRIGIVGAIMFGTMCYTLFILFTYFT